MRVGLRLPLSCWLAVLLAAGGIAAEQRGETTAPDPIRSAPREFTIKLWNSEAGLPQNFVRAILQTRDGYLWLGTQFGLVRFDGNRFTIYDRYNTREMRHDTIACLAEDASGTLWIGTEGGVLRWTGDGFELIETGNSQLRKDVRAIIPMTDGVWLLQDEYIARYRDGNWKPVTWPEPGRIRSFRHAGESATGELLLGGKDALLRFDSQSGQLVNAKPPECPGGAVAWWASKSRPGTLWVIAEDYLHCLENGRWEKYPTPAPVRAGSIQDFLEDRAGSIWIASRDIGLLRFHNGRIASFDLGPAVRECEVHSLFEDREGNLWVGSECGLIRLTPNQVRTYTKEAGLDNDMVWSVSPARAGGVWASTRQGFNWIRDDEVRPYTVDLQFGQSTAVQAVIEDPSGTIWLGRTGARLTRNGSVLRFQNGALTEFNFGTLRFSSSSRALYLDQLGRIWVASNEGVICWQDGEIASFPAREDDPFNANVRAIHVASDETLWLASYRGGLRHYRDGQVKAFDLRTDLASDAAWAIYEDTNHVIWAGTEHGLVRVENDKVFQIDRRHGLAENIVNQILEDDAGNFWLSGLRGIHRVSRSALNEIAAGRSNHCHVVTIGQAEGMENAETNGESQPSGCKTADGRLWFPTLKGVVSFDPKAFRDNRLLPPVVIERVAVDDKELLHNIGSSGKTAVESPRSKATSIHDENDIWPHLRLPAGSARVLEIDYTANSLTSPERVRFKYRLFGHDPVWRDVGNRRHAIYTNLRPGDYRFQVIACNNHGYWNESGASFTFTLAPHPYQTWPFWVACSVLVVMSAAAIQASRLRTQRRFLRLQQLTELERVRARIAEDMHDDIGASLSQIAILSEVARRDSSDRRGVESTVERVSAIARGLVDSLSELVWATNPRNDTLDNMVAYFREYAASYFDSTAIRCRLDFPGDLPATPVAPETRRALFLVLKEALHNVLKHSGAAEVSVTFRIQPVPANSRTARGNPAQIAELRVEDNGRGLPAGTERRTGNGLRNMRARMESAGGSVEISSAPGRGTTLQFTVPLRDRND